jgi:hypothetical protein
MRLLAWLVGLAITVAFVRLGPGKDIPTDLIGAHLQALLAVVLWTAAALGAGGAALKRWAPRALQGPTGWAHALVTGLLLWGLGGLVLGGAGQLHTPGLAILFGVLGAGWLARPAFQGPRLSPTELTVGLAVLLPLLVLSLAPATGTDALYTHLGVPAQMLMDGSLVGGLLHPQGSRPLILHLPYAALMHTGGASAPGVMHLLLSGAVLALVVQVGAEHLGKRAAGLAAALLLMGSWTFLREAGRPGNDVVAALATLVALDAALRGHGRALAIAAGTALSIKYTAAGALVGIFLVAQLSWRSRVLAGLGALALLVPWWGRNLLEGLHPLFPFTGWPETAVPVAFQYLEKYGAGRAPLDFAMLPWRVFMDSEIDSFRFMGRLNPAWLVLGPFGLWVARKRGAARRIAVAGLVGAVAWAAGPQWLRYLVPALPLLALAAGAGLLVRAPRALAASALLAGLVGLPANCLDVIRTAADRIEVVTGEESQEDYLARHHHGYKAIAWANAHLPADARVAMLFSWAGALLERRQVLGSVEDHVPTRHWILRHGDQSLHKLAEAGVTHAVVRRARFLKNAYPFLTPDQRAQHLQAPVQVLQDILLMQAQLLAQEGPIRIYRLPEAPSGS